MTDSKAKWDELGSKCSSLGLKLKMHFEQARSEAEDVELRDALRKMADAIEDAFSAMGEAAKDPAVKTDLKEVGQGLTQAMSATFAEVSDDVRKAFKRS